MVHSDSMLVLQASLATVVVQVTTGPSNDIYKLYQDSFKWINLQRARTLADFGTKLSFEKVESPVRFYTCGTLSHSF